jgi:acyl-CoA thioesterase I
MNQNRWIAFLYRKYLLAGLFCLFIPIITAAQTNPTILVLGDSLSAEYGLSRGTGWVKLLEKQLQKDSSSWLVFNASISGETSSGGLARLPKLLEDKKPRIVLLELGANDALRGLSIEQTQNNLRKMIQLSKQSGAKVLLFGIQIPPNYGKEYAQQFKDLYKKLAEQEQIQLLPFFFKGIATNQAMFQADNIHPNEQAQSILFKNVWGAMAPYYSMLKAR